MGLKYFLYQQVRCYKLSVGGARETLQNPPLFWCALSASWVCSSPLPSSSFPWQLLPPAPSWAVSSIMPLVRCFPVNGFSLQSRGKISSKFHYRGTKVTSLLSSEPLRYTAEEASNDQVDKLTHSVDISQSYPKVATVAGMEAMHGLRNMNLLYPD